MSLADKFLRESYVTPSTTLPVNRRPVGRPERIKSHILESQVKRKVKEGNRVYSESEVAIIQALVERADRDPFRTNMTMDTDDLSRIGLEASSEGEGAQSDEGEGGYSRDNNSRLDTKEDKLPVTMALTTPDNTPGGDEPIPPEVLASMDVLNQSGEEQQIQPQQGSGHLPTTVPDAFGKNSVRQGDIEPENTRVQTGGEPRENESDNGILAAFESRSFAKNPLDAYNESAQKSEAGDEYMAKASAAIMGANIDDVTLMTEDTVEAASHNHAALMEQMRGGKSAGTKPEYRPRANPVNALDALGESISKDAKEKYAGKMNALL
jgi:hypothetical protein